MQHYQLQIAIYTVIKRFFFYCVVVYSRRNFNFVRYGTHNRSWLVGNISPQGGHLTFISIAQNKAYTGGQVLCFISSIKLNRFHQLFLYRDIAMVICVRKCFQFTVHLLLGLLQHIKTCFEKYILYSILFLKAS